MRQAETLIAPFITLTIQDAIVSYVLWGQIIESWQSQQHKWYLKMYQLQAEMLGWNEFSLSFLYFSLPL